MGPDLKFSTLRQILPGGVCKVCRHDVRLEIFCIETKFCPGISVLDSVSQVSRYIPLYLSAYIFAVGDFANISPYAVWWFCAKYFDWLVRVVLSVYIVTGSLGSVVSVQEFEDPRFVDPWVGLPCLHCLRLQHGASRCSLLQHSYLWGTAGAGLNCQHLWKIVSPLCWKITGWYL